MEDRYAGKVWAVYRNMEEHHKFGSYGIVISMFDSSRGAEKYVEAKKRVDELRGDTYDYSVVPWLVGRG